MRVLTAVFAGLAMVFVVAPSFAQDAASKPAAQGVVSDDASYESRLDLATQMHKLRPVREQVDGAIEQYAQSQPPDQQAAFVAAMRNVLNPVALERISIDAYAEVYTEEELKAMVEYYSKPEARSASNKYEQYAKIVYPEIVRMLDKAAMRVKTGGVGP